jgi:acyl-coenzyme A thioesterase PaaI-like protein
MGKKSLLQRTAAAINRLPGFLRPRALSLAVGRVVPFVGTSRLRIEELGEERVIASIHNRRRVQNHIQGVHAAAMALLAETASGFVVGMNLPDDKLPLIKSLKVDFKKRTRGDMRVVATLSSEQRERIRAEERGDLLVEVHVTDESGSEPIQCEMLWAWVPKKRKA